MKHPIYMIMMVAMSMSMLCVPSIASADDDKEMVYGRELMTDQERQEERMKMRSMTNEEREQYRAEKHERMKERAKEQGKVIPDEPGERGKGMQQGQGMRQGKGMGQGQGMGGGRR